MITCEVCETLISTMVDGESSAEHRTLMYGHLSACDRCDAFMIDTIAMQLAIARKGISTLPDAAVGRHAGLSGRGPVRGAAAAVRTIIRKKLAVPVPVLAGAVFVIGAVLYTLNEGQHVPPVEQEFRATRTGLTTVAFPVVHIP
jgi:anti-sigma factor RsiW